MSGLLLGTIALRKFIAGDPVLHEWLQQRTDDTLHLTVVSVGEVLAQAEAKRDVVQRRLWTDRLTVAIPRISGHGCTASTCRRPSNGARCAPASTANQSRSSKPTSP